MGEIARALDAELVKIEDGQDRSKLRGYLRSGMEAMSKKLCPIAPLADGAPSPGLPPGHHRHSRLGGPLRQSRQELFGSERRVSAPGFLRGHPQRRRPLPTMCWPTWPHS